MAIASTIRSYPNIQTVKIHLGQIEAAVKKLLASFPVPVEAATDVVRIGQVTKTTGPSKLTKKSQGELKKISESLHKLTEQRSILSNMLLNLNTNFSTEGTDVKIIDAIRKNINSLQSRIDKSLKDLHGQASTIAENHISEKMEDLAKKLVRFYKKKFDQDPDIFSSSGMEDSVPVFTYFIVFTNVKNSENTIDPKIVMALSEKDHHIYFNPGLVNTRLIGTFKLGFELNDQDPERDMLRRAQAQMIASKHLGALQSKLVPEGIDSKDILNKGGKVHTVQMNEKQILVSFKPSIKTQKQAEEAAQEVYKILHTTMVAYKKSRDRIQYAVKKRDKYWGAEFWFTTGDRYSGRTLEQHEIDKLNNLFSPEEVKVINRALNDQ